MRVNKNISISVLPAIVVIVLSLGGTATADQLELFTDICPYILDPDPQPNPYPDTNWDWWQQEDPNVIEEAIYLCAYDGASGHFPCPNYPTDGNVNGCYSTLDMGSGGDATSQSLGVSGCDIEPYDERDTRVAALFNLSEIKAVNGESGAILDACFRFCIDWIVNWDRSHWNDYLAPTMLYVSIYAASEQNYWHDPPDPCSLNDPNDPNDDPNGTHIIQLQDEFDGDPNTERQIDIRVNDGPWEPGLQPLTRWYLLEYGPQFYEVDFTEELREIVTEDPDLEWVGFTIRPSLDGEVVYVSLDAQEYHPNKPIPPTLYVQVSEYLGDLDDDGDVDLVDFTLFAQQWGKSSGLLIADLNVDGTVDVADLALFCENWLKGKSP